MPMTAGVTHSAGVLSRPKAQVSAQCRARAPRSAGCGPRLCPRKHRLARLVSAASGEPGPSSGSEAMHVAVETASSPPTPSTALVTHLAALLMGLRDHAASITQHLHTATSSSAPATAAAHAMGGAEGGAGSGFSFGFHLPAPQGWGGGLRLPGTGAGGSPQGPSMRQLPLGKPPAVPPSLSPRSTGPPHTQHQVGGLSSDIPHAVRLQLQPLPAVRHPCLPACLPTCPPACLLTAPACSAKQQ